MLNTGKIYLHKTLGNTLLNTVGRFIYTKYSEILLCWTLWEDVFTQNTGEYFMLNTVGRFIYTKYQEILYDEHCGNICLHKILGILYVEHCGKIYLHKILGNTLCWTLWQYLFTQNTGEYIMLNTVGRFIETKYWDYFSLSTVGRFIYTKYWETLYVEHCGKINYTKYWEILSVGTLWEVIKFVSDVRQVSGFLRVLHQ